MSKKIKKNFFGNIFFSKKQKKPNEDITELQEINFQIRNELTIKKIVESILNYHFFFITISPDCDVQLKKTKYGLFIDNDYNKDTTTEQYILLNLPSDSKLYFDSFIYENCLLPKHVLYLFESFNYILSAIKLLHKNNILHFDIRPTNILLDQHTQTPRIIHFKKSISIENVSIQEIKPYFYATDYSIENYEIWPLEVYIIYYFLWLTNDSLLNGICSKKNISEIIELYVKTNKLNTIYSETQLNKLKQESNEYLLTFENSKKENIIKELFDYWNSWDLYCFSYMYCNICNILILKTKNTYFISILNSYLTILRKNLHPNPKKRLSLAETKTKINHILYENSHKQY